MIYYYLFIIIGLSLESQQLTIQLNNHFLDEPNNNYSTTTTFAITDEVDYNFYFYFFIELDR